MSVCVCVCDVFLLGLFVISLCLFEVVRVCLGFLCVRAVCVFVDVCLNMLKFVCFVSALCFFVMLLCLLVSGVW